MRASILSILALVALLSSSAQAAFPPKSAWCLSGECTDPPAALVTSTLAQEAKIFGSTGAVCGDGICNVVAGEHCLACPSDCGTCGLLAPVVRCANPKHAALTFDDGPSPFTQSLVNILDSLKVKATFFPVGDVIMGSPELYPAMKAAIASGHEIGLHTFTHRSMGSTGRMDPPVANSREMTPVEVRAEAVFSDLALQSVIGSHARYLRLPFLEYTDKSMAMLDTLGYVGVSVNVDSNDWQVETMAGATSDMISTNVAAAMLAAKDTGIIVLQHDTIELSTKAVPQIVNMLQASGYTLVTLSTCIGLPAYRSATEPPLFASRFDPATGRLIKSGGTTSSSSSTTSSSTGSSSSTSSTSSSSSSTSKSTTSSSSTSSTSASTSSSSSSSSSTSSTSTSSSTSANTTPTGTSSGTTSTGTSSTSTSTTGGGSTDGGNTTGGGSGHGGSSGGSTDDGSTGGNGGGSTGGNGGGSTGGNTLDTGNTGCIANTTTGNPIGPGVVTDIKTPQNSVANANNANGGKLKSTSSSSSGVTANQWAVGAAMAPIAALAAAMI
ncbi:hypothetical protein BC828DRAFT_370718 [Blastocladiella britannica]|nr:hypothetical protein BC828DRAFT_370718 [Blastocladiella britannica]